MCEICRQHPCANMCPNADEPKVVGECGNLDCRCKLTEDYTYFTDNDGNTFCSTDCALAFHGVREEEYCG